MRRMMNEGLKDFRKEIKQFIDVSNIIIVEDW